MIVPSFIAPFGGQKALKKEMEQDPSRMGKRGVGGGGGGGLYQSHVSNLKSRRGTSD